MSRFAIAYNNWLPLTHYHYGKRKLLVRLHRLSKAKSSIKWIKFNEKKLFLVIIEEDLNVNCCIFFFYISAWRPYCASQTLPKSLTWYRCYRWQPMNADHHWRWVTTGAWDRGVEPMPADLLMARTITQLPMCWSRLIRPVKFSAYSLG